MSVPMLKDGVPLLTDGGVPAIGPDCCCDPCPQLDCGNGPKQIIQVVYTVSLDDEIWWSEKINNGSEWLLYKTFGWAQFNGTYVSNKDLETCSYPQFDVTHNIDVQIWQSIAEFQGDEFCPDDSGYPDNTETWVCKINPESGGGIGGISQRKPPEPRMDIGNAFQYENSGGTRGLVRLVPEDDLNVDDCAVEPIWDDIPGLTVDGTVCYAESRQNGTRELITE